MLCNTKRSSLKLSTVQLYLKSLDTHLTICVVPKFVDMEAMISIRQATDSSSNFYWSITL